MKNKRMALFLICILLVLTVGATACNRNATRSEDTESIIVRKEIVGQNQYYLHVEYELEGFHDSLGASIKVPRKVYDDHDVGDVYVFSRPVSTP